MDCHTTMLRWSSANDFQFQKTSGISPLERPQHGPILSLIAKLEGNLTAYPSIQEAAVLSTCNRFEIYVSGRDEYQCMADAIDYLHQRMVRDNDTLMPCKNMSDLM